jgi:hypothetical protein
VAAELPWAFLEMVCVSAPAECKELLVLGGGAAATRLTSLLHKALEHAAGLLHDTAVDEIYVSRPAADRGTMPTIQDAVKELSVMEDVCTMTM